VIKHIYKIIILLGIFMVSLYYFGKDMKEVVFDHGNTTTMKDATFPLVTIKKGEEEINLLHGYSSNLKTNMVREVVTPLDMDQSFEVLINQQDYIIKKMNYEIREFTENVLIEDGTVSVFEESKEIKKAKIKFNSELAIGKEYAVKITLITSQSKKMYYYLRVKVYEQTHLGEELAFVKEFHNAIKSKDTVRDVQKYLEPKGDADNSSLSYVNINSSIDLVSWGKLKPTFLTKAVPSVIEVYTDVVFVQLEYYIEAEIADVKEQFQVKEFYRIRYGTDRMYLLNYERYMEAVFDPGLVSTVKSQLKLGISSDYDVPYLLSADEKKLAFVRNKELWLYNFEENEIIKVFSFCQKKTDYLRDRYDQHDIQILRMDAEGNLDFIVYGYMNRGEYEGKVGIVLYQFIRAQNRIEERVFIPVDEPYQVFKEKFGKMVYINSGDIFYFHMYDNIYSYNLSTHKLTNLAENIGKDQLIILENIGYIAWQDSSKAASAQNICIMNMEAGKIEKISTKKGYYICLMGKIDSNIIYGFAKKDDIDVMMDGRVITPLSEIEIASVDKKILKRYKKSVYYITDIKVNDNVVVLNRVKKEKGSGRITYVPASQDYIINMVKSEALLTNVTTRTTKQALTELYLTLPKGFVMEKRPKVLSTVNTVITEDPTVRPIQKEQKQVYYYPYIHGRIEGSYEEAADAIAIARDEIGVVINSNHQLIWERGVKSGENTILKIKGLNCTASNRTMETCIKLMLLYKGVQVNEDKLFLSDQSAYDAILKNSGLTPIRLTGAALDDVLYFVSCNRPVIAMTDTKNAVLIYGYDSFNITVIDPKTGQTKKIGIKDSNKMFEEAGNVFISYLE
jgi:hypothetical protein